MSKPERVVIVGAGLAGMRAAERVRELGFTGETVILGSENSLPYHRPALSKQFLQGSIALRDLAITTYDDIGADWRLGTTVSRLDPDERVVHLSDGEQITYDGLVIATGVEARKLKGAGRRDRRVISLRRVADAVALREALVTSRGPVIVLGTGFTGCEIASTLRAMNREVIVLGRGDALMGKALGPEVGGQLTRVHLDHGVKVKLGVEITRWQSETDHVRVELSNGRIVAAAAIVAAIGSVPSVQWLAGSGLPVEDGVVCGPTCHVDGYDDIVAAGDVAQWQNLRFDTTSRRVEHWINATEMGRAAADSLLFGRHSAPPFMPIPRFWSEQHGLRIQGAGAPSLGTHRLTLWSSTNQEQSVTGYLRDGHMVGVVGMNCPASFLRIAEEELARPNWSLPAAAHAQLTAGRQAAYEDVPRITG
jgi:NADPH-dependent 2,4-dienoyl-CoA reductase/sulfur reductase-like enzyme